MPPMLDALQAIFSDALPTQALDVDKSVVPSGGTNQSLLQPGEDGTQTYISPC